MDANTILTIVVSAISGVAASALTAILAIGKYKERVDRAVTDISDLSHKIDDIRDRLSRIEGGRESEKYFASKSPVSLTDKGKSLLLDSGGNKYLDEHFDQLLSHVKAEKPSTAYDVQELSRKVLLAMQSDKSFVPLKNYAYKEGKSLKLVVNVMAIELRDRILQKEYNFSPEDIDKRPQLDC